MSEENLRMIDFSQLTPDQMKRDTKRAKATSTRMANAFVKKLEKGRLA